MFNLDIKYVLLSVEYSRKNKSQAFENLVSKEMEVLIDKIDEIEKKEKIQNNELWKATIMSAITGLANITLRQNGHPKLFTRSKVIPAKFWTLLQNNNILLKESDERQLRIKHEMFAYAFLSVVCEKIFYNTPNLSLNNMDIL
jgi:hypothetical protein